MLLIWLHADKNPDMHGRQMHPVLCRTADPMAIVRTLSDNVGWRGRGLYLHSDSDDPKPETAFAMVGWGRVDGEMCWVADAPGSHGFLRDRLVDWVERGMEWTIEQRQVAYKELSQRNWDKSL